MMSDTTERDKRYWSDKKLFLYNIYLIGDKKTKEEEEEEEKEVVVVVVVVYMFRASPSPIFRSTKQL